MLSGFGQLQQPVSDVVSGHGPALTHRRLRASVRAVADAWRFTHTCMRHAQLPDEGPATGPIISSSAPRNATGGAPVAYDPAPIEQNIGNAPAGQYGLRFTLDSRETPKHLLLSFRCANAIIATYFLSNYRGTFGGHLAFRLLHGCHCEAVSCCVSAI
jgi:hypothetical protein